MLRGAVVALLATVALGAPTAAHARPDITGEPLRAATTALAPGGLPAEPGGHRLPRAAAVAPARHPAVPVTVMSFNVCGGVCRRGEVDRTAAGIVRTAVRGRASVVLLQELCHAQYVRVRHRLPGWSGRFAAQARTRHCGRDRRFGVALLTRGALTGATVRHLPTAAGAERRVLLGATATVGGRRTFVAVVHLSPSPEEGLAGQLATVAAYLRPRARRPLIAGGDFNAVPGNPGLAPLHAALTELDPAATPTFGPHRRKIDYVFVSDGWFRRPRARVVATTLSDHRVYLGTADLAGG